MSFATVAVLVLAVSALAAAAPAVGRARHVLAPAEAERLFDAVQSARGVRLVGLRVERDAIDIQAAPADSPHQVFDYQVVAPGDPRATNEGQPHASGGAQRTPAAKGPHSAVLRTPSGALLVPPNAPVALTQALEGALGGLAPPLDWRQERPRASPRPRPRGAVHRDEAAARQWWNAVGRGPLTGPDDGRARVVLDPRVRAAWASLRKGDRERARAVLSGLFAQDRLAPLGALTLWAAVQGVVDPEGSPRSPRVRAPPAEPRTEALQARRERLDGRLREAALHLDAALSAPLLDPLAIHEARALGWSVGAEVQPAVDDPLVLHARAMPWFLAGVVAVVALGGFLVRRRDTLAAVALALGAVTAAWVGWGPRAAGVPRPVLPVEVRWPLAGGPCAPVPSTFHEDGWTAAGDCSGKLVEVGVTVTGEGETLDDFHLSPARGAVDPAVAEQVHALTLDAIERALRKGWRWRRLPAVHAPRWPAWRALTPGERARLALAGMLVVAAAVITAGGAFSALRLAAGGVGGRIALAGFACAVAVHLVVPSQLLMSFSAYDIADHLARGTPWRYGAGAVWFYGPPMWVFGPDHAWIQRLNRLWGVLAVALASGLARSLWPRTQAAALVPWLLVVSPITALLDASESIVVAPGTALLAGLYFGLRRRPAAAALAWMGAALGRPEMAPVALLAMPVATGVLGRRGARAAGGAVLGAAPLVALAAVAAVRLGTVAEDALLLSRNGALAAGNFGWLDVAAAVPMSWTLWSVLVAPHIVPVLVPLGLIVALRSLPTRRPAAVLGLVALGWQAMTAIDLSSFTAPRLHEPILWIMSPIVAAGLEREWAWVRRRGEGAGERSRAAPWGLWGALALLVALSGVVTVARFAPNRNELHEERLWRRLARTLPADVRCIYAIDPADPPPERYNFRYHPTYLFEARTPPVRFVPLSRVGASYPSGCDGRAVAVSCVHCYVRYGWKPGDPALVPICERMSRLAGLVKLWSWRVANLGDTEYPIYPAPERTRVFELAVWRLRAPEPPRSPPHGPGRGAEGDERATPTRARVPATSPSAAP